MRLNILFCSALVFCSNSNAQINIMGGKSAESNATGMVVNIAVGGMLAGISWTICGVAKDGMGEMGGRSASIAAGGMYSMAIPNLTGSGCEGPIWGGWKPISIGVAAMSSLSYAQGAMNLLSMAQSKKTEESASGDGSYGAMEFDGFAMPDGSTMSSDQVKSGLNDLSNAMKKNGMGIDLKTGKVTMPNGKSFDASILGQGNGAIAAAMGLPESAVERAMEEMRKATNKVTKGDLEKYKLSFSGGGGAGGAAGASNQKEGLGLDFSSLFKKPKQRGVAAVSGLQKNVGGTSVGVAQDDIFRMVQRRYQEKTKADFFSK